MRLRFELAWLALVAVFVCAPASQAQEHSTPADHAAAPAAQHDAPANLFAGGVGNAIVTLIVFGAVVVILGKKAWPAVLTALNEREKSIREALENAQREREESEKLLAQYKQQLDEARKEASAIVEEGRRDAAEVRRRLTDEARKESDEMIARAKREIQLATSTAIKELHDQTADLAVQVAGGIIHKELKADDHKALVTESLQRMKASKN